MVDIIIYQLLWSDFIEIIIYDTGVEIVMVSGHSHCDVHNQHNPLRLQS